MPYKIKKSDDGFKVCKKDESKCFSKQPMGKKKAKTQMRALYANEGLISKLDEVLTEDLLIIEV